jgi:hypothetical protein
VGGHRSQAGNCIVGLEPHSFEIGEGMKKNKERIGGIVVERKNKGKVGDIVVVASKECIVVGVDKIAGEGCNFVVPSNKVGAQGCTSLSGLEGRSRKIDHLMAQLGCM